MAVYEYWGPYFDLLRGRSVKPNNGDNGLPEKATARCNCCTASERYWDLVASQPPSS